MRSPYSQVRERFRTRPRCGTMKPARDQGPSLQQPGLAQLEPLIKSVGLTKRFRGLTAVDHLDLEVRQGDVFGFLGPNGAGKSTTLRMMVGLVRPTSGSVTLFGHDVWHDRVRALTHAGVLIESPAFYKYMSGRDNLRILANTGNSISPKEIDAALNTVGLLDRAKDKVKAYSQGMRQRLGIALAIINHPRLVLLDEPTNGLDPQGMKEVRDLIKRLSAEHGITIFLSSHLLHEVEQICTRIAVVDRGKVLQSGDVGELLRETNTYRVSVDSCLKARQMVEALPLVEVVREQDDALDVKLLDGFDAASLNHALVTGGVQVSGLAPVKTSLEELYLELVGG